MDQRQTGQSSFQGTWLVSEYVYSPTGDFSGVVRQRRVVEPLDDGRVRVTQECEPGASLGGGPMESFAGTHVFELSRDGRARRYHGPAVVGTGLAWGEAAMTGRGLWPAFGHNFTSFAVVPETDLQMTGGAFFNGTEMVANIAGIATPQVSEEPVWPELEGPERCHEVSSDWVGRLRSYSADGEVLQDTGLERRYRTGYRAATFVESANGVPILRLSLEDHGDRLRVRGRALDLPMQGLGKRYGWLTALEICLPEGGLVEWTELLDASRGHLVAMRRWWFDGVVDRLDLITLSPEGRDNE